MPNLIGQSLGRYHILEQLGEGGMATVYKAFDTRLERDVAVKVIRVDQFAPAVLERILHRFDREAKALARLTHPNIIGIIDYGEHEGSPYLVMPYLPGGTLKEKLGKPMPWREAAELLLPIAQALQFAHTQNIIHRDVKPSNILITLSGEPMLTDFGIAKLLESEETQTLTAAGAGVGTPEYMSPEQGLGRAIDARADIYSLGIVFYELVTGHKPFTADTPMETLFKHTSEPLPPPSQFVRGLPAGVEQFLIHALAKKPEGRYPDMGGFARSLKGLLAGKETEATADSKPQKTTRPVPREDSQATIEQAASTGDDGGSTRRQDTTQAERQSNDNKPREQDVLPPGSPLTLRKKSALWLWAAGLSGFVLLVLIILTVLFSRNLFRRSMAEAASTPTRSAAGAPVPSQTPTQAPTSIPLQGLEGSWSNNLYSFTIVWQGNGYVVTYCDLQGPASLGNQHWDASKPKLSWTCYYTDTGANNIYYYFEIVSIDGDQLTVIVAYPTGGAGAGYENFHRVP
jgi:serine/threonine protein kinase